MRITMSARSASLLAATVASAKVSTYVDRRSGQGPDPSVRSAAPRAVR
jgi:hypothetical protein